MDFIFEQIRTGGDRNLAYLIGDRAAGVAAAVDPSFDPKLTLTRAEAQGLRITHILNTHGHGDHTNGNAEMRKRTRAVVGAHPDSPARPGLRLDDGTRIEIGSLTLHVMHVPGHCPDHVIFHLPSQAVVVTGDHLFVGKIGGTPDDAAARDEYASFERMMAALPDETSVWPGHDYGCRPSSTIGLERRNNPFLLAPDLDAFLELKRTWATFKAEHGLR